MHYHTFVVPTLSAYLSLCGWFAVKYHEMGSAVQWSIQLKTLKWICKGILCANAAFHDDDDNIKVKHINNMLATE